MFRPCTIVIVCRRCAAAVAGPFDTVINHLAIGKAHPDLRNRQLGIGIEANLLHPPFGPCGMPQRGDRRLDCFDFGGGGVALICKYKLVALLPFDNIQEFARNSVNIAGIIFEFIDQEYGDTLLNPSSPRQIL